MPDPADLAGLCAVAALCAALLVRLPIRLMAGTAATPARRATFFAAIWLALLIPVGGLPLAAYVRGMVGDPSISSLLVFAAVLLRREKAASPPAKRLASLLLVLFAAATLYPLALGAGPLDPYRWGFGDGRFLAAVLALALLAHLRRWPLATTAIALAVLAWSFGLYESRNLWDYLIDPLLVLYALGASARLLWRAIAGRMENRVRAE